MTTEKSDQRLFEQLQRLFIKDSFKKTISKYRKEIGIPAKGFGSNEEYVRWIKKNDRRFLDIQSARVKIGLQFGFPLHFSLWIEAYLLLGDGFKQFSEKNPTKLSTSRGFEKTGYGCAMEKDPDFQCVNIKVFPGASYRDVMRYVQKNMKEIEDFLAPFDKRVRPIRERRQSKRDLQIYEYFKKGLLDLSGKITIRAGDPDRELLIPAFIREMDMDTKRNIIREQIKRRK